MRCFRRPLRNNRPSRVGPSNAALAAEKIGLGIEIAGYADGVFENDRFDVIVSVDVNAAHQLQKLARLRQRVAAGFVDRLADEMQGHFLTFPYFRYAKVSTSALGTKRLWKGAGQPYRHHAL